MKNNSNDSIAPAGTARGLAGDRRGDASGTVPGMLSGEGLVDAFLGGIDVRATTKKSYGKAVRLWLSWVDGTGRSLSELTRDDVIAYKEDLLAREEELSSQTVAFYLSSVRKFYSWAESRKLYPNIAQGVKPPKVMREFVKQHLTVEECGALLGRLAEDIDGKLRRKAYGNGRAEGLRDLALVNLLLRTGMRTIEVSRANIRDITRRRDKRVILVQGKGRSSKDEFIPLSDKAMSCIDDYLSTRPTAQPSEPLFICEGYGSRGRRLSGRRIQEIAKEALRSVGIDGHEYSAHSLRHTCAVILLEAGVDPYDVQKFMRHRSIDTTEIYLESIEEQRRLARASEAFIDRAI